MTKQEKSKLIEDYEKYERYVYTILGTSTNYTKTRNPKVKIYYPEVLCMSDEDLIQEGRMFLWEALLNYGKFPKNSKNKERKLASKSTFVYNHIKNMFINLGIKTTCKKYKGKKIPVEECFGLTDNITGEDYTLANELNRVIEEATKIKSKNPKKYKQIVNEYLKN